MRTLSRRSPNDRRRDPSYEIDMEEEIVETAGSILKKTPRVGGALSREGDAEQGRPKLIPAMNATEGKRSRNDKAFSSTAVAKKSEEKTAYDNKIVKQIEERLRKELHSPTSMEDYGPMDMQGEETSNGNDGRKKSRAKSRIVSDVQIKPPDMARNTIGNREETWATVARRKRSKTRSLR